MEREFGRFLAPWAGVVEDSELVGRYPVDVREDADHIFVDAEMPGFGKDDIAVTLERGVLSIVGERKPEEVKGQKHLSERRYTKLARSFTLPTPVDEASVEASLKDGVLSLKLHKRQEVKPRRIEVR
jgi:HSP20 family protein